MQGDCHKLAQAAATLQELDLTDNLLASWAVLSELAVGMPQLRCLNLSQNIMSFPAESFLGPNHVLQILILNSCRLTWTEVSLHTECTSLCQNRELAQRSMAEHCTALQCISGHSIAERLVVNTSRPDTAKHGGAATTLH